MQMIEINFVIYPLLFKWAEHVQSSIVLPVTTTSNILQDK